MSQKDIEDLVKRMRIAVLLLNLPKLLNLPRSPKMPQYTLPPHLINYIDNMNKMVESAHRKIAPTIKRMEEIQKLAIRFRIQYENRARYFDEHLSQELVSRGWYIVGSLFTQHYEMLHDFIQENKEEELEEYLQEAARSSVDNIYEEVIGYFPERKDILTDAFEAHNSDKYSLSIPALLCQADGIAFDILDVFLFTDLRNKGRIQDKAQEMVELLGNDPMGQSIFAMLTKESGIRLRTDRRDLMLENGEIVSPLNRHGVLHGVDIDYPIESNSLRCIALIGYLVELLESKEPED